MVISAASGAPTFNAPMWLQVVVALAAGASSFLYLWSKVFRPTIRAAAQFEKMLPILYAMTAQFEGKTYVWSVLDGIAAEFQGSSSGSTLGDIIDRLEATAKSNAAAAEAARKVAELAAARIEDAEIMATAERKQMLSEITSIRRSVEANNAGVERLLTVQDNQDPQVE